MCLRGPNCAV
ncbi:Protein of unknown function, partial [Gryllus bimaculatus]